ncbi:MAG: four-carbon acid sugar kinase family protein [Hyphomicrobiales bacterium]
MIAVDILADDLTGALDAGACFATPDAPLPVRWRASSRGSGARGPGAWDRGAGAFDSETRSVPAEEAARRTVSLLSGLGRGRLAFKKVDSLLRGNTIHEIGACIDTGRFASVVIAPAFPAQGRITRGGQQYSRGRDDEDWLPIGPNLMDASKLWAKPARLLPADETARGSATLVCDCAQERDLASLPRRVAGMTAPLLWCGTAGLARALAGVGVRVRPPPARRILVLVGSDDCVSARQVEALDCGRLLRIAGARAAEATRTMLTDPAATERVVVLRLIRPELEDEGGAGAFAGALGRLLAGVAAPDLFIATGGDTLMAVLAAVGADHAQALGEIEPGIPLAMVKGGAWDACSFVSKAGGFGHSGTLRQIVQDALRKE